MPNDNLSSVWDSTQYERNIQAVLKKQEERQMTSEVAADAYEQTDQRGLKEGQEETEKQAMVSFACLAV